MHPDVDPDHLQNLMGSKLDQDPFSDQPGVLLNLAIKETNKQTNSDESNTSFTEERKLHILLVNTKTYYEQCDLPYVHLFKNRNPFFINVIYFVKHL